jgi:hypothetical protein
MALLTWHRGLRKHFPVFLVYLLYEAIETFTLYAMDILPTVSPTAFWRAACAGILVQGLVMFAVVWELFSHLVSTRPHTAKFGAKLIVCTGAATAVLAALAAGKAPIAKYAIVSYDYILGQTVYLIECGLLLFVFTFAAYCRLTWSRWSFGIALGFGISACVHLATWSVFTNTAWFEKRYLLDFLNMATYHACVLIWLYYLLLPPWRSYVGAVRGLGGPSLRSSEDDQHASRIAEPSPGRYFVTNSERRAAWNGLYKRV